MGSLKKMVECNARVAIIADRDAMAKGIGVSLQNLGFEDVGFYSNGQSFLQDDSVVTDWCIVAMDPDGSDSLLQFLNAVRLDEKYGDLAISALVPIRGVHQLALAFEMNLLSWHPMDTQTRSMARTFKDLFRVMKSYNLSGPYIAAHYLREFLKSNKIWNELINLERSMSSCFYQDSENFFRLAEAYFLSGQKEKGRATLAELQHFDPSLSGRITNLFEQHVGDVYENVGSFASQQGVQRAMIIEPERVTANLISLALSKIGIRNVEFFQNGEEAWNSIDANQEPDLIVCEWQLEKLSGPFLLQRIRAKGFLKVPIIVVSDVLQRSDHQLLKELTVSQILRKPLTEKQTVMAVAWSLSQSAIPTEAKTIERKIIECLNKKEWDMARSLGQRFRRMPKVSPARKLYVEGAFAFFEERYPDAVDLLTQSLKTLEGDNVDVVSMLGRTLLKLGDFKSATRMLEKASGFSPHNILRLCELAEMRLQAGELKQASDALRNAALLDPEADRVKQTQTKYAVVSGNLDNVTHLIENLESFQEIVSFTNNLAVAKARSGETEESVRLYQNLINLLPAHSLDFRAIVTYNMALAFLREGNQGEAARLLATAVGFGHTRVTDKASGLLTRIEKAMSEGRTVRLQEQEQEENHMVEERLMAALENVHTMVKMQKRMARPGLAGIYRINGIVPVKSERRRAS